MPQNHTYQSDPPMTRRRMAAYDRYMASEVLAESGEFACASHARCLAAARRAQPDVAFYEGQLGYIGDHYDLRIDGTDWRTMIVGMELGGTSMFGEEPRSVDRVKRSAHHELAVPERSATRNQHMSGVIHALRYMLGLTGGSDFVPLGDDRAHLLHCYSLVNARLCSAVKRPGTRRSAGVSEMTVNCLRHLTATVEILEPSLVIVQSLPVWRAIRGQVGDDDVGGGYLPLTRARFDSCTTLVAHFSHPRATDYNWSEPDAPYFVDVVKPTLSRAVSIVRQGR